MSKLSVIILTDRDDDRFAKAISSAMFADEVIVFVCGSLQLPVPTEKKLKIVYSQLITDYAAARNLALQTATSDWVLFLDSDEQIRPSDIPVIWQALDQTNLAGIEIQRVDSFLGERLRYGETGANWILRIGKREEMEFERPVHEVASVVGDTAKLPIQFIHEPHPSLTQFWQAVVKYSQLEATYRVTSGQRFQLWQLVVYPVGKFISNYILKRGFLDGWRGFIYAVMMSSHSLMVRIFWYEQVN
jgi:glycosyltransferase involved in cell wall biosynthesis